MGVQPSRASRKGCCSASTAQRRKRTPSAPSMRRWSYDKARGNMRRGANCPVLSLYTGSRRLRARPRIATSGALMIGVKLVPPRPPRLVMVNVPPCISSSVVLRLLARSASWVSSTDNARIFFWSTLRMTGTRSPRSVLTHTDMVVRFVDDLVTGHINASVKLWETLQGGSDDFEDNRRYRELPPGALHALRIIALPQLL